LSGDVEVQVGGAGGVGLSGPRKGSAFYKEAQGLTTGFRLGVEVLFVDLWIQHNQYFGEGGLQGTWTRFMAGLDTQVGLGERRNAKIDERGYFYGGLHDGYLEIGGGLGYGAGTQSQVSLPLNNAQVSDKGVVAQFAVGGGYNINKYLQIGGSIPVELGLLLKNDVPINSEGAFYTALQYGFVIVFRGRFGVEQALEE